MDVLSAAGSLTNSYGQSRSDESAETDFEFEALFRTEYPSITRATFLIVGEIEQARDIAQDAFLRLFLNWEKVRHYDRPGAWVRKVALRAAVRSVRSRAVYTRTLALLGISKPTETNNDLDEALMSLPARQRLAVVMRYYQRATASEIGEALGCSEATARVHLHRGRQRLMKALGREESDVAR